MCLSFSKSLTLCYSSPWLKPPIPKFTLRRISTNGTKRSFVREISTLDPSKLTLDDWMNLTHLEGPVIRFRKTGETAQLVYGHAREPISAWPSTRGFLYFHRPTTSGALHPAAGSLRFRSVETPAGLASAFSDSTSNAQNLDVSVDRGGYTTPWSIPLLTLRLSPYYSAIWNQLQHDGLVTRDSMRQIDELASGCNHKVKKRTQVLEDITQQWIVKLGQQQSRLMVLAEDKIYRVELQNLTMTQDSRKIVGCDQGIASVRFELDNEGRIVLRLMKYLVPPDSRTITNNAGQTEGELIVRHRREYGGHRSGWRTPQAWSADPTSLLSPASVAALMDRY
ncbi:hypothetical protein BKA70DRAFT_1314987, partial [Coprinopsis sp. MPI-PUGE-AT-0042]